MGAGHVRAQARAAMAVRGGRKQAHGTWEPSAFIVAKERRVGGLGMDLRWLGGLGALGGWLAPGAVPLMVLRPQRDINRKRFEWGKGCAQAHVSSSMSLDMRVRQAWVA